MKRTTLDPDDAFLDLRAAGALVGVNPITVRRWISTGTLPGYRLGQRIRVRRGDIIAMARRIPSAADR